MRKKVLISSRPIQAVINTFQPLFDSQDIEIILPPVRERLSEEQLFSLVGDVDGVICGDDYFTERVLRKAAPRLKVISKWGTGIDSIDTAICRELNITVCNTPASIGPKEYYRGKTLLPRPLRAIRVGV